MLAPRAVLPSVPLVTPLLLRLLGLFRRCAAAVLRLARRRLVRVVLWACAFHLAAVIAVMASMLVPDDLILEQLVDARTFRQLAPNDNLDPPFSFVVEWSSECALFTQNLAFEGVEGWTGLLKRFAFSANIRYCENFHNGLIAYEKGEDVVLWPDWRYWHGLTVLVRPLLALVGVNGVRAVAFALAVGSVVWLSFVLARRSGRGGVALLWGPLALSGGMPQLLWASHHTMMLAAGWAGAAVLGLTSHKRDWKAAVAAAAAAGAVYGFVHRVAYTAGVCVTAAAVAFACSKSRRIGADLLAPMAAWLTGFSAMWASKWMWAIAVNPHTDVIGALIDRIAQKTVGGYSSSRELVERDLDRGVGAWEVVEVWLRDRPLARVIVAGAVLLLAAAVLKSSWKSAVPALVVVAAPTALLLVSNNHLDGHAWFDFRMAPMIIGAMLLVLTADIQQRHKHRVIDSTIPSDRN